MPGSPSPHWFALTYVLVLASLVGAARVVPPWAFACASMLSLLVLIVVGALHLRTSNQLGDGALERVLRAVVEAVTRRR